MGGADGHLESSSVWPLDEAEQASLLFLQNLTQNGSEWNITYSNGTWRHSSAPFDTPSALVRAAAKAVVLGLLILATVVGKSNILNTESIFIAPLIHLLIIIRLIIYVIKIKILDIYISSILHQVMFS